MRKIITCCFILISTQLIAQTWEDLEELPASADVRHHPATFSVGGIGYVVTGSGTTYTSMNDFYAYDPTTDTWETMTDFPGGARGFAYAVNTETKGYVGFGSLFIEDMFEFEEYNDLWEYDPATDTWTELAPCPCSGRSHPAMVLVNDKIYVGLGENEFGDLGDWWEYDIATDTWTEKTDFPSTERHHPYYFGIGDYVYVGFGHHTEDIFNDFYRYDPATDSWTTLSDFPEQGRVAGTQFAYDGKGYILSGQGETHENLPTGEFWEYDVDTDTWQELTAHPGGGRWAPGTFLIDDVVYLTCGQANTGERRDLMAYDFAPGGANIDEEESTDQFQLNPNPSNGIVQILGVNQLDQLMIYDSAGKQVYDYNWQGNQLDLSTLTAGIYFVHLSSGEKLFVEKLVIR